MPTTVAYRSYAKINLYLEVLHRRKDGYHNIETIFQTVGLFDELYFGEEPRRVDIVCNIPELEIAETNLVCRAAMLLKKRTGYRHGVHVRLEKHIPIAAGLAGGSGNAAATLIALNRLWSLGFSLPQLRRMALELGSDVPYCTFGGTAAATCRGEELHALSSLKRTWFVLVHPPIAVSAARIYNSPALERSEEKPFAGRTKTFRGVLHALEHRDLASVVFNRMEPPVFATHPALGVAKARLLELGCTTAAMSGSGPTLFGVCPTKKRAVEIAAAFEGIYKTSVVHSVPDAVECLH